MKALAAALLLVLIGFFNFAFTDTPHLPQVPVSAMEDEIPLDGECGDINGDMSVDVLDTVKGLKLAVEGDEGLTDFQRRVGDADLLGDFTLYDAGVFINGIANGITVEECGIVIKVDDSSGFIGLSTTIDVVLHFAAVDISGLQLVVRPENESLISISTVDFPLHSGACLINPSWTPIEGTSDVRVVITDLCNEIPLDPSPQTIFSLTVLPLALGETEFTLVLEGAASEIPNPRVISPATFVFPGHVNVASPP